MSRWAISADGRWVFAVEAGIRLAGIEKLFVGEKR
jgi:hypothetical protein